MDAPTNTELVALRQLTVDGDRAEELRRQSLEFPSVALTQRQLCDLELLLGGGFTPLTGFMGEAAYESVVEGSRLPDGTVWPIPITLDIEEAQAEKLETGGKLALRDTEGFMLAALHVEDVWRPDKQREAEQVYQTNSMAHAGVRYLHEQVKPVYVGGRVEGIQLPSHYDYEELRHTPEELRHLFAKLGWRRVVGFHTSQPMHRLQRELTMRAAKEAEAHILVHPVVGMTKPRDLAYHARVRCYQAIEKHYPHSLTALSLLPLAMRMAGPREALWHALVRRNYGCTNFIVGPDHASPPREDGAAEDFYEADAARELVGRYEGEIGIQLVPFDRHCYAPARREFIAVSQAKAANEPCEELSSKEIADRLAHDQEVPSWFTYPEVLKTLRHVYPPRRRQGIALFFTGLSGSGKSTLAQVIYGKLVEEGSRPVTMLDGDVVRLHLSSELGFSKAHRDLNVRRIGFVASEITKNGGVALCAPIAPYARSRKVNRELIAQHGAYIEIHVSTPLEVCEARDRKGLYAKARKGIIPEFTGISDPYEVPENPELRIDTAKLSPMEAAQEIYLYLLREGYLDTSDREDVGIG